MPDLLQPRGVLPYQEVGGGPGIEFRGKIWGKVQSSSPNKRKNLGSSVATTRKSWERITILGAFGVISEIQRAKFGVSVTYIFGGKIWVSDMNFRGKIWGQAPRPPNMEVPPLDVAAIIIIVIIRIIIIIIMTIINIVLKNTDIVKDATSKDN